MVHEKDRRRPGEPRPDYIKRLVRQNLGLANNVARKVLVTCYRRIPLDDLAQEGAIGLLHAARRYDETRGFTFATYASYWVRRCVLDSLRLEETIIPPTLAWKRALSVRTLQRTIGEKAASELLKNPKDARSRYLPLRSQDAETSLRALDSVSLTDPETMDTYERNPVTGAPPVDPEDNAILQNIEADVALLLDSLSARMRFILRRHYGLDGTDPETFDRIGAYLGVSRQRAMQLHEKALAILRAVAPGILF